MIFDICNISSLPKLNLTDSGFFWARTTVGLEMRVNVENFSKTQKLTIFIFKFFLENTFSSAVSVSCERRDVMLANDCSNADTTWTWVMVFTNGVDYLHTVDLHLLRADSGDAWPCRAPPWALAAALGSRCLSFPEVGVNILSKMKQDLKFLLWLGGSLPHLTIGKPHIKNCFCRP